MDEPDSRVILVRGTFTGTGANGGPIGPPGNGSTITIFDSLAAYGVSTAAIGGGNEQSLIRFNRLQLNLYSSHDSGASGLVFSSTFDRGANYRTQSTQTFTNASAPSSYDYLMKGGHVKIVYTNSANVLTAWELELIGIYDRNPGS